MKEKLPKVFANKINKHMNNNEKIHMTKEGTTVENAKKDTHKQQKDQTPINKKISKIMNSKEYIYKIPVKIETTTDEIKTTIIGRNTKNIITYDNKLIKIEDIKNIEIDK